MTFDQPPHRTDLESDDQHGFTPARMSPEATRGLTHVIDGIIAACEQEDVATELVIRQLTDQQLVPEAVVRLLQTQIRPMLTDLQEDLRVARRTPAVKQLLLNAAHTRLLDFFMEQRDLLQAFQGLSRLAPSDMLAVSSVTLEHSLRYKEVSSEDLIRMNESVANLHHEVRELILATLVERMKEYLEDELKSLEHRSEISIQVRNVERRENQRTHDKETEYFLHLGFDSTPDDTSKPRGNGVGTDMNAISRAVKEKFPGMILYPYTVSSSILQVRLPL